MNIINYGLPSMICKELLLDRMIVSMQLHKLRCITCLDEMENSEVLVDLI